MTHSALQRRTRPNSLEERRAALVTAVEAAIALLDEMGGDEDLEPSCKSSAAESWDDRRGWTQGATNDHEEACEDEGAPIIDPDDDPDDFVMRCEVGLC